MDGRILGQRKCSFDFGGCEGFRNLDISKMYCTSESIAVEYETLDELLGDQSVDMLNLSINGAEHNRLKGAAGLLDANPKMKISIPPDHPDFTLLGGRLHSICLQHDDLIIILCRIHGCSPGFVG